MRTVIAVLIIGVMAVCPTLASAASCSATLQNKVGDTISVTATLSTSDPNENGEGEPLYVSSSGGEITATVGAYFVPTPFLYKATGTDESVYGTVTGIDGDEGCTIVASVNPAQPFTPEQKQQAGNLSGKLGVGGAIVGVGGVALCTITTGGICGAVVIGGAGLGGLAAVSGNIASDPSDPNYTLIAVPSIGSIPSVVPDASITQNEADAFNALFANQAAIIGTGNAAYVSGNRAQGAHDAGDSVWEARQVQAAQLYAHELGVLYANQANLLVNLRDALASAGFAINVTPSDVLNFEYQIAYQGLPAGIASALTAYGATPGEIQQVRNLFLVQDIYATAGRLPDALASAGLIGAFQTAADAFSGGLSVDIKPDGSPNAVNPGSKGVIPVAVLGTDVFDVTTLDPASTRFGPYAASPATSPAIQDVNGDGKPDLVLHFATQDTGITCGDTMAVLTGKTTSGTMMSGADSIVTTGCQ
jgi:hypothetical protein